MHHPETLSGTDSFFFKLLIAVLSSLGAGAGLMAFFLLAAEHLFVTIPL